MNTYSNIFDFKNAAPSRKGPFNWDQTAQTSCGAVKIGSDWLIDQDCEHISAQVFVTGFETPTKPGSSAANPGQYLSLITLQNKQIDLLAASSNAIYSADSALDGIKNPSPMPFFATPTTHIQFSVVIISLRSFSFSTYPSGQTIPDTFTVSVAPTMSGIFSNTN